MPKTHRIRDIHGQAVECLGRLYQLGALRGCGEFEAPLATLEWDIRRFLEAVKGLQHAYSHGKSLYDGFSDKVRLPVRGIREVYGAVGRDAYEVTFKVAEKAYTEVVQVIASREGRFDTVDEEIKRQWGHEILDSFKVKSGALEHLRHLLVEATSQLEPTKKVRVKRKTRRKTRDELILAALNLHHQYDGTGILVDDPIGVRDLSGMTKKKASPPTVTRWFQASFPGGHQGYKTHCVGGRILLDLQLLNGDYTPRELYDTARQTREADDNE